MAARLPLGLIAKPSGASPTATRSMTRGGVASRSMTLTVSILPSEPPAKPLSTVRARLPALLVGHDLRRFGAADVHDGDRVLARRTTDRLARLVERQLVVVPDDHQLGIRDEGQEDEGEGEGQRLCRAHAGSPIR